MHDDVPNVYAAYLHLTYMVGFLKIVSIFFNAYELGEKSFVFQLKFSIFFNATCYKISCTLVCTIL